MLSALLARALTSRAFFMSKRRAAAEHVNKRASRAVEIAGKDLTEENRTIFYDSLESIVANLRVLSKKDIPE